MSLRRLGFLRCFLGLFVTTALAACAVGPDFHRPPLAPAEQARYTAAPLPEHTAKTKAALGASQHIALGQTAPDRWWTLFRSPALNALMEDALTRNSDVQSALAALREAREQAEAGRGVFWPSVSASYTPEREKFSGASYGNPALGSSIFNLYNASVNVSYTLDLFGQERRQVEALDAAAEAARYQAEAAYLTLTGNLVTAIVQYASLTEQIAQTQETLRIETRELRLLERQFTLGSIAKAAVLQQSATLAETRATLPPLAKQLAGTATQLAVLAGRAPGAFMPPHFTLATLHLPENLPVALPSSLTEQRPDIRQAEAALHQASAEIGVATANQLPQLTLSGAYGVQAGSNSQLFRADSVVWNFGAGLAQPIFRGGALLHEKRAAVASFDAAAARYRGVVLQAFKNVADSLQALGFDAEALQSAEDAALSAEQALALAEVQYKSGGASYPQLLDAERTRASARLRLAQAQAARLADTAALFQALGGGWWHRPDALLFSSY